jgi:hypothetical protein
VASLWRTMGPSSLLSWPGHWPSGDSPLTIHALLAILTMHASQAAQASAAPYAPYAPYELLALLARNLLCNNCFNSKQCQHAVELPVILSVYLCIIRAMSIYFNEKVFFQSWQRGVNLAGPKWFGDGKDPTSADTKWKLAPRVDEIAEALPYLSSTERVFLAAMVSFYNDDIGSTLLQRVNGSKNIGMATIASSLDERRRRVIGDLMLSYCGW